MGNWQEIVLPALPPPFDGEPVLIAYRYWMDGGPDGRVAAVKYVVAEWDVSEGEGWCDESGNALCLDALSWQPIEPFELEDEASNA